MRARPTKLPALIFPLEGARVVIWRMFECDHAKSGWDHQISLALRAIRRVFERDKINDPVHFGPKPSNFLKRRQISYRRGQAGGFQRPHWSVVAADSNLEQEIQYEPPMLETQLINASSKFLMLDLVSVYLWKRIHLVAWILYSPGYWSKIWILDGKRFIGHIFKPVEVVLYRHMFLQPEFSNYVTFFRRNKPISL